MSREAFNKIIKMEYLNEFKEWYSEATTEEMRGLQLMERIYATKGRAKIGSADEGRQHKTRSLNKVE